MGIPGLPKLVPKNASNQRKLKATQIRRFHLTHSDVCINVSLQSVIEMKERYYDK